MYCLIIIIRLLSNKIDKGSKKKIKNKMIDMNNNQNINNKKKLIYKIKENGNK